MCRPTYKYQEEKIYKCSFRQVKPMGQCDSHASGLRMNEHGERNAREINKQGKDIR